MVKSCLKDYAIAYRDSSLCEKIDQGIADLRRDTCFIRVGELTKDTSLLEKVTSEYYSSICEQQVMQYQPYFASNLLMRSIVWTIPLLLLILIFILITSRLKRKKKGKI